MGSLYLVRHGQASFGADNYDQLSELGQRQCERLGSWFAEQGIVFEAALVGRLRRQTQSLAAIEQGLGRQAPTEVWPGLDEYDSAAVIAAIDPRPQPRPADAEQVRAHFRLLRSGLLRWMAGEVDPAGMPSHRQFAADVAAVLDHVRRQFAGNVLVVSSGGPISTAVGQVLQVSAATTVELNLRMRNSSVTELAFNPKRHALVQFNALPHLADAAVRGWITYA
ncbi:histidine phosphatase family protein [Piscinibacter sakaiensis]|uniref:histidine phosphatase family protein n=1 Tax=Piscinibacter sakaiensis TaxID=1547922 RepID=UPI003AAA9093